MLLQGRRSPSSGAPQACSGLRCRLVILARTMHHLELYRSIDFL